MQGGNIMNYPYNDEKMIYDYTLHRYILQEKFVQEELGINMNEVNAGADMNPSNLGKRLLKQVSNTVYSYIYKQRDRQRLEYDLAKVPSLRPMILEMLLSQTLYMFTNGVLQNYSGVNVKNGTAMDINALRGRAKVSDDVEIICQNIIPELGRSLSCICMLPPPPYEKERSY